MCQSGPTYISDICELGHKYPIWQLERVAMTSAERELYLFGGHYEVPPSDEDYNDENDDENGEEEEDKDNNEKNEDTMNNGKEEKKEDDDDDDLEVLPDRREVHCDAGETTWVLPFAAQLASFWSPCSLLIIMMLVVVMLNTNSVSGLMNNVFFNVKVTAHQHTHHSDQFSDKSQA